jgi:hypothetical protein
MTHDDTSNVPLPRASMLGSTCGQECRMDFLQTSEPSKALDTPGTFLTEGRQVSIRAPHFRH